MISRRPFPISESFPIADVDIFETTGFSNNGVEIFSITIYEKRGTDVHAMVEPKGQVLERRSAKALIYREANFGVVEKRFYPTSRNFLSDLMVVNSLSFLCIVMLLSPCFTNPPVIDLCTSQKPFLTYPDRYFTIIEIFNEGDGIFP